MISFKSKNEMVRYADKFTRAVNNIYPHISESRTQVVIDRKISQSFNDDKLRYKLCKLKLKNGENIENLRKSAGDGLEFYRSRIDMLKNKKVGNCHEEAILTQLIAKINGLKNIYTMRIFFNRNRSGEELKLKHVVAVVTDKPLEQDLKYKFKNKEAIILDPWLEITEFAGEYFNKLRMNYGHIFQWIAPDNYTLNRTMRDSKNMEVFNKKKKEMFKSDFSLSLVENNIESYNYVLQLRKEYPELILK